MKKRRIFLILFSVFLFLSIGLSAKALGTITCNAYCTNGTYGYYTAGECSSNASCATYANQFGFSSWPFCTTALDSGECYYSCISKGTTACRGGQICYCANYAACAGCPAGKCTSSGCAASCPSSCTTYTQCQVCGLNRCWGSSASSYTCKSGCASNGYYAPASSECCSGTTWNSSTKICATTPVADTTPPTGTISASPNPATTAQTITVTISAYDAGGVNLIYINRQAAGWNLSQSCGGATSCTKTFSYSETTAGSYRYQGYIYDMAGNGAFALYGGSSNGVVVTVNAACACTQGSLASNNCTSCNYRTPYYYNCNCSTYAGSAYYDTSCSSACKPNGSTCSSGTECQSGYCVDGYCCNTSCTGTCYQCNKSIPLLGQNPGTCYPVEANYYPQHAGMTYACANAYSYCRTGYCDGSGGCQAASDDANCGTIYCSNLNYYYSSSKTCYLRSYTNLTSNRCAYLGACKTANSTYCTSYSDSQTVNCNADCQTLSGCSGTTAGTCVNIADGTACQTNKLCSNGVCVDKKTNGTACSSAGECQSGYCVDGYCCNSACTGTCQQCNMSYNLGNCSYVNSGYTPIHGSCVGTCRTGTCDGWGNCTKSPVGTSCGTGYACDANGDCTRIQNPNGTACSSSLECQSGNCIDGYCCNSSCGGTCQKCSLPGSVGICTYISNGEDPDDECSGSNSCNGTGGCTACSFLNPSTAVGKWQRVWRIHSTGACLGDGPDETSEQLDNNWGTGIIAYNRSDDIEMQSARIINISTPGTYRIGLGSDDGVKLYIDGGSTLSFAKWDDHAWPGSPEYMDVYLTAGNHTFELDYYDNSGDARLTFVYNLLFPVCSRANPVKSGNSWSITNDCWYKGNACYNDTSGTFCTDSCVSPAGEGIAEAENTITIPQGSWDMAITMNNISGLAKCLGDNCVFDVDCESSLASAGWTLYLDGEWLEEKQNGMSIIATGDGVQESSGSGNPISSTRQVNCTKPGGCALRIVKQFVYWVWARSSAFGGDKPAYAYGQLKADISVNLNEVSDNIPPTTAIVVKNALTGENMSLNPSKWYKPGSYTAYFTDNDNLGVSNLKSCQYKIASCSDAGNGTGCGTNIIPITDRACNGSVPVPIGSTAAINRDGWSALIYSIVTDNANNVTTTQHYLRPDINPPTTEIK